MSSHTADVLDQHPLKGGAPTAPVTVRSSRQIGTLDWRQAVGLGLIGLGALAIMIAWYGVSGTLDPAEQMPYISSGGFGGAALIAVGVTLLSAFEHARDRAALESVLERLESMEDELSAVRADTRHIKSATNGTSTRRTRTS